MCTVLLGACLVGGGFCGDDALSCLFGYGDHKVVDFLEVEVCHCDECYGVCIVRLACIRGMWKAMARALN